MTTETMLDQAAVAVIEQFNRLLDALDKVDHPDGAPLPGTRRQKPVREPNREPRSPQPGSDERLTDLPIGGHTPYRKAMKGTYRVWCDCGWEERWQDGPSAGRLRFRRNMEADPSATAVEAIDVWFAHVLEHGDVAEQLEVA